jgi:ABC-type multidrug transport system fused ATPase/permease subunit
MIQTNEILDVAKGISDYGMSAITAACFLVICLIMFAAMIKFVAKTINNLIGKQQESISNLTTKQSDILAMIKDVHHTSNNKLLEQVHVVSSMAFDNSKNSVIQALILIKKDNHLENNEYFIEQKVRLIVENIHNDRNSKFDNFNYRGKSLSEYTDPNWISKISALMVSELYASDDLNINNASYNIHLAYQSFKVEFYKNLTKE